MRPTDRILTCLEVRTLAAEQDSVVSRQQLTELGLHRAAIRRRLGKEWQEVGPHVVVLHNGPLSRRQQWWAGILHAGPGSALGHLTALEADGLKSFSAEQVCVVARHGRGRRHLDTDAVRIRVYERTVLEPSIPATGWPPRTTPDWSTVDAASAAVSDRQCRAIIAVAVQQRLVLPAALQRVAEPELTMKRRKLILETIADVEGGSHSLPELEWLRGIRLFRFPEPSRQSLVQRPNGRYFLDSRFDRWRVAVEINGVQHAELLASEADAERRLNLSAGGLLVVDLSSYLVRHDLGVAMLRTGRALHSRGWEPEPYTRSRLLTVAERLREPLWLPMAA